MKKIAVVTGGGGFIGSHTVDRLVENGFEVRVIDNFICGRYENLAHHKSNAKVKVEEIDICDVPSDSKIFEDVNYVFHFAGIGDIVPSIQMPEKYMKTNVLGTVNILEASRRSSLKKFVYAASSSCYGKSPEIPTTEHAKIDNEYPYALSKYQGEQAVFHWGQVYKVPFNSVRIFNAYGTRSKTSGAYGAVLGVFLKQKLEGKPLTIVGDGSQLRDFLFVTDVANGFYLTAKEAPSGETFNLGAGSPVSVNRLAELLDSPTTNIPKRPGEPDFTHADISKIKELTSWEPKISFEEGVSIILNEIEYWRNAPLWDKDSIEEATQDWFKFLG